MILSFHPNDADISRKDGKRWGIQSIKKFRSESNCPRVDTLGGSAFAISALSAYRLFHQHHTTFAWDFLLFFCKNPFSSSWHTRANPRSPANTITIVLVISFIIMKGAHWFYTVLLPQFWGHPHQIFCAAFGVPARVLKWVWVFIKFLKTFIILPKRSFCKIC